ncbi:MAG: hypothetical protein R3Y07_02730 [Eubacteriales bacterium]
MLKIEEKAEITDFDLDVFAKSVLPCILEFYKDEEIQNEFAMWKEEQELK